MYVLARKRLWGRERERPADPAVSPALSDFSQSMTRRTDQACTQLSQSVTEALTDKIRSVMQDVQQSSAQRFEQANAAEKVSNSASAAVECPLIPPQPLTELMSHLVDQLGSIGSIASTLHGLRDLPQALSDISVFRVALDTLTDRSNRLIAPPAPLHPRATATNATVTNTSPLPDEVMPILEQLKTGLSSQDGSIAQILQYMSGLAQEATELRSTLGAVLNVIERLSNAHRAVTAPSTQEHEVITPRTGHSAATPHLPTPITTGPSAAARDRLPARPSKGPQQTRGQSSQMPADEKGSSSRTSSTDSSGTNGSTDVFGPKRPILKSKSLNVVDPHDEDDFTIDDPITGEDVHWTRSKVMRPEVEAQSEAAEVPAAAPNPPRTTSKPKKGAKAPGRKRSATTTASKQPAAKRKRASPTSLAPVPDNMPDTGGNASLTPPMEFMRLQPTRDNPIEISSSDSLPATQSPPPEALVRNPARTPSGSSQDPFGRGADSRTEVGPIGEITLEMNRPRPQISGRKNAL